MAIKIPWQNWKYTVAFCIASIGLVFLGQYTSQENGLAYEFGNSPLYDVVHHYLPDVSEYRYINHLLVILVIARFLHLGRALQEYLFLAFLALDARAIIIMVTSQPSCMPSCFPPESNGGSYPWNTCFDFLYSGHTVSITVAAICTIKHIKCRRLEKLFWALYIPASALWISMSREHYTADVLLAMLIGALMSI